MKSAQQEALHRAKIGDRSILPNYFGAIEQAKKNELLETVKLHNQLKARQLANEMRKNKKKTWLIIGLTIGITVLLVAGLIALAVFFPAIGIPLLLAIGGAFKAIFAFIVSKIFNLPGGLLTAGVLFTAATVWRKTAPEWTKAKEAKLTDDLKACEDKEKELESDIKNVREMNLASEKTLDAIAKLSDSKGDTLELSCSKPKESKFNKFIEGTLGKVSKRFQHLEEDRIGNVGINNICLHLLDATKENPSSCKNLNLANNNITDEGAIALANMLLQGQMQQSLNIQKIDLSGNPLGLTGLKTLQTSLEQVFTVVELKQDTKTYEVKSSDIPPVITTQDIPPTIATEINKQLLINRQLQSMDLDTKFSEAEEKQITELFGDRNNFKEAVLDKVKKNYNLSAIPGTDPQKPVPTEIASIIKQNAIFARLYTKPTFADYLEALRIDGKRCTDFVTHEKLDEKVSAGIKAAISASILTLNGVDDCSGTLLAIFPESRRKSPLLDNVKVLAAVMAKLPKNLQDPISLGMEKYVQAAFALLGGSKDTFQKKLEASRLEIATSTSIKDEGQRRAMLNILDSALHPELGKPESVTFKIHQLQKLITDQPAPQAALGEFLRIYIEVGKDAFTTSISGDFKKNFELLISILEKHPIAELSPKMQGIVQEAFTHIASLNATQFRGDQEPWGLEKKRREIATDSSITDKERREILNILDSTLHPDLTPEQFKMHQLQKLVTEHPSDKKAETFKEFVDIYKDTPEPQLATVFSKIDQANLVELVRADVHDKAGETVFTQLRRSDLSKHHKEALLKFYFQGDKDPTSAQKAELLVAVLSDENASKLFLDDKSVAMKTFRDKYLGMGLTRPGYIWGQWKLTSYEQIKTQLEALRSSAAVDAAMTGEQRKAKLNIFDSLLHPELKSSESIEFKTYQLRMLVVEHQANSAKAFQEFADLYATIPEKNLASCFKDMKPTDVSKLVTMLVGDVYDGNAPTGQKTKCTALKTLDEPHRLALLTACFGNTPDYSKETNAQEKAALVSRMISINGMFDEKEVIPGLREEDLYYCFTAKTAGGIYTSATLKTQLESRRQALATGKTYTAADRGKLNALDSVLHPELGKPESMPFKIYQLQMLITQHPADQTQTFAEFMSIYETAKGENLESLYKAPLSVNAQENLKLFVTMVQKLPKDAVNLIEAFKLLEKDPSGFKKWFEQERTRIAKIDPPRKDVLTTLDTTLNPTFASSVLALNLYQLQKLVVEHQPDNRKAFAEFANLCAQIPEKDLVDFFAVMEPADVSKLVTMLVDDVYDGNAPKGQQTKCTSLKTLDAPRRLALLEACFGSKDDYPEEISSKAKAALVSRMIAIEGMFDEKEPIPGLREEDLYYAFTTYIGDGKYDYPDLKEHVETRRIKVATRTDMTIERKRELLSALDLALNPDLGTKESVALHKYQLKKLASEAYPTDLGHRFEEFVAIYAKIPRADLAASLASLSPDGLVELVRKDVHDGTNTTCTLLKNNLDEPHRLALLEACFSNKTKYQSETSPRKKAALVSAIITTESMFSGDAEITKFRNELLRYSIQSKFATEPYTYKALKEGLEAQIQDAKAKGLGAKAEALGKALEEGLKIIQTELQGDLIDKFICLQKAESPMNPSTFKALKEELAKPDYRELTDTTGFDFAGKKITAPVAEYVTHVCQLRKNLTTSNLDGFMKEYTSVPPGDCASVINSIDRLELLKFIAADLGTGETDVTCDRLKNLDPARRVALLERCLFIDKEETPKDTHKKAELISKLFETKELFDNPEIKKAIYWAILPYRSGYTIPYHNLTSFEGALPKTDQIETFERTLGLK